MSQTKEQVKSLQKALAECRTELENEKKNIKIKTVEKKVLADKCGNCRITSLEKARSGYFALKNGYIGYLYVLGLYSLYLTFFQIFRAEYFIQSLNGLLCGIENSFNWLKNIIFQMKPSTYIVVNFLIRVIVFIAAIGFLLSVCLLIIKFYCHKYIWHWGTAMEALGTCFLIINLDKWIFSWWQKNLILLFFILHAVYLIIMFCVRIKMDK